MAYIVMALYSYGLEGGVGGGRAAGGIYLWPYRVVAYVVMAYIVMV